MIVFWRLLLAYYICAVLFYNQRFVDWRVRHDGLASVLQTISFALISAIVCRSYLSMDWQFAELWPMPGWVGILVASVLYSLINRLFVYRLDQKKGYTLIFLIHDTLAILALFICSPLHVLYNTGNLVAEAHTVFLVGFLVVTKMMGIFIYAVEKDLYGREYPTIDESFVTMLMRLIFFLIVLLPGWRWVVVWLVWVYACGEAHQNRLMDLSRFSLYFSIITITITTISIMNIGSRSFVCASALCVLISASLSRCAFCVSSYSISVSPPPPLMTACFIRPMNDLYFMLPILCA